MFASDLNAEFTNITSNGEDLGWPASKAKDLNGQELILDANGNTSITADTDDRIDFRLGGADLFQMDGTVATPVNGINFVASATGVAVHAIAFGTDTNIDLELRSKGSGDVVLTDDSGNEILVAADVASAVNEVTVTNAVTTAPPFIQATGGDTNIDLELRSKGSGDVVLADDSGNEILIAADVASAVNEVTITNAATGNAPIIQSSGEANIGVQLQDSNGNEIILGGSTASAVNEITVTNAATGNAPEISATGGDTNIDIKLTPKGTGRVDNILPRSYGAGCDLSNGTDATNDIDIAVGEWRDTANTADLVVASAIGKQIDVSWASGGTPGTPTGGLSSSLTLTNDTTYHVILGLVSSTEEVGFDTSATGANLVTDHSFTNTRRIGSVNRKTALNQLFIQDGDRFDVAVPVNDVNANNPGNTAVTRTLSMPVGINIIAIVSLSLLHSAGATSSGAHLTALDTTDTAPSATLNQLRYSFNAATGGSEGSGEVQVRTNTLAQIRSRMYGSSASVTLTIDTYGWIDRRGRDA